jgi:hypothetical protein
MNSDAHREHDLTKSEVLACPLFRHLTDEQAQEVIDTLKLFTKIIYEALHTNHH